MTKQVRAFAPATVANVACAFDILGFAVHTPGDEVVARLSDEPGVKLVTVEGDNGRLPRDVEDNTASGVVKLMIEELFDNYMRDPSLMPTEFADRASMADTSGQARVVADYIAGMTDRFAIAEHERTG